MLKRIPFDALVMGAVIHELQPLARARVQKIWQPEPSSVVFELYAGEVAWLWISWDAEFPRVYLSPRKPPTMGESPALCMALRKHLDGKFVERIQQVDRDRVLWMEIGGMSLVFEMLGKQSNLLLVDSSAHLAAVARPIPEGKGSRTLVPGRPYERPVTRPAQSPFLKGLGASDGAIEGVFTHGSQQPVLVPGYGAYPLSVASLGYEEIPRETLSSALANYFDVAIPEHQLEQRRRSLRNQLERVRLAREVAISDLEQAQDAASKADRKQRMGELILAYQGSVAEGASTLDAYDYDGSPISIALDSDLTPVENANAYFERAKKAKARKGFVADQLARQRDDLDALNAFLAALDEADSRSLDSLEDEAKRKRWLFQQCAPVAKDERPYQGKRIRETLGPGGWLILIGENSEANDYLTLRVAKPDDWWLHVRGAVSAHVVIPTRKQPLKVPRQVLEYAALVAAQNSGQKHASYVPVDYTLKRYVRKVKGAPAGTVLYTHEKTIHVDPGR